MIKTITEFIIGYLLMITYLLIINSYSPNKIKLLTVKNIIIVLVLAAIPAILHNDEYSGLISFITFCLVIITFKLIFKKNFLKTIIDAVLVVVLAFLGNAICSFTIAQVFTIQEIRSIWYIQLLANIIVIITALSVSKIPFLKSLYSKIMNSKSIKNRTGEIVFLFLIVIGLIVIGYDMYRYYKVSYGVLINFLIIIIIVSLFLIYMVERINYNQLSNEYDEIFKYVKEFETWIEQEQLNRHEYKNQLAALRIMTKDKKIKDKIDSIINENININNEQITILKNMPSNGLKGLLYYKIVIANKQNINLLININEKVKKDLSKLTEKQLKILCRLIGIYFDNALEEAVLTKKKQLTLEIYELNDNIEFVITNSLKTKTNLEHNQQKGISTKGINRGKGLYFASKIVEKTYWLNTKVEIKKDYYIQRISINKKSL